MGNEPMKSFMAFYVVLGISSTYRNIFAIKHWRSRLLCGMNEQFDRLHTVESFDV